MRESLSLVFQYFFAVGSGVGAGLLVTAGGGYVLYKKLSGIKLGKRR